MPIYEYECRDCGRKSEFLVGVGEGEVQIRCTHCGSLHLDKVFSTYAVARSGSLSESRHGKTCCGRDERCAHPPCGNDGTCTR